MVATSFGIKNLGIRIARLAIIVAFLALWELLSRTAIVDPRLLPSASDTLATLGELLQRASVRGDLAVTASEVVAAFALAVPVGCLIGFLIAESSYFADVMKPLLFFAFSIPKSIFLPMFILVFGVASPRRSGSDSSRRSSSSSCRRRRRSNPSRSSISRSPAPMARPARRRRFASICRACCRCCWKRCGFP